MDNKKLSYLREKLIKEANKTDTTIEQMRNNEEAEMSENSPNELSNYDNHPADLGSELYTVEMNLALKVHEQSKLNEVNIALNKFENGSYGKCENCKKEIEYERLEAIPY